MKGNMNFVSVRNQNICFLIPPPAEMSKEDALEFAAWIVALADDSGGEKFNKTLEKVHNS